MNLYNMPCRPIDIKDVRRTAFGHMRQNGNYRRTALMIGLMLALINVPVMLMDCLTTWNVDLGALDMSALAMINTRLLLFQAMIAVFISPALELGKTRYMINAMKSDAGSPTDLFDGLSRGSYFVSIRALLWKYLLMYGWMILPTTIAAQGVVMLQLGGGGAGLATAIIGGALALMAMVSRLLAYSLQFYLLSDSPRMGAMVSLRLSTVVMHGRMNELFRLSLTMLPFMLIPMLPNAASLVFDVDSNLFGIAMALCSILLGAACYPMWEAAMAEYYLRVKAQIVKPRAQKAGNWPYGPDEDTDDSQGESDSDSDNGSNGDSD